MRPTAQAKFRRRVKLWLLDRDKSVADLAKQIGRRRDTVSTAIHNERFPRVRAEIEKAMQS